MKESLIVKRKIREYDPSGNLGHSSRLILAMCEINHISTKAHMERVGLLSERVAKELGIDSKAAFFAGLLHDVGKLLLPRELFDGHEIDSVEYGIVKEHALNSFKAGYGIGMKDFPRVCRW